MKDLFDLKEKVAVITGASSGLGRSASNMYASMGAKVAILDLDLEKLNIVKEEIEQKGGKALAIECDVTKEDMIKSAVDKILEEYGHIDILLNNAGVAIKGGVDTLEIEEWDKSFNVNVRGMYLLSKYIIPGMKERKYGKIINIASVNAIIADKSDAFIRHSYNASKAAILGLTKGMACSYARYGITVNAIGPALFKTGMTEDTLFKSEEFLNGYNMLNPSNRPGNDGELNGTILYLSTDASSYTQGQFIVVDGGCSIV